MNMVFYQTLCISNIIHQIKSCMKENEKKQDIQFLSAGQLIIIPPLSLPKFSTSKNNSYNNCSYKQEHGKIIIARRYKILP